MTKIVIKTPGVQGARGNSIISDAGAPEDTLGIDGDLYLDQDDGHLWAKTDGEWSDSGVSVFGLSAYEVAVKHGYVGTEEEWNDAVNAARVAAEDARDAAEGFRDEAEVLRDDTEAARDTTLSVASDVVSMRPALRGAQEKLSVVSELSAPAVSAGKQVILITKTAPIPAFCDGTDWWNMTTGAKIEPWWMPPWAIGYLELVRDGNGDVDADSSRVFMDGQERALSYLTDNGDGSYNSPWLTWFGSAQATFIVDYEILPTGTPSGNLVTFHAAGNRRVEHVFIGVNGGWVVYMAGSDAAANFTNSYKERYPGNSETAYARGRRRALWTTGQNVPSKQADSNWALTTGTSLTPNVRTDMLAMAFGRRTLDNAMPLTNCTLHRVVWTDVVLDDAKLKILGSSGAAARPVHLIGDSFLNGQALFGKLAERFRQRGLYIPISQDGVGGSSLVDQAARYALDTVTVSSVDYDISRWKDSILVIMDGGLSDNPAASLPAIRDMLSRIGHDRWVYVEPAPNNQIGDALYDQWLIDKAAIKNLVGNRYITTLEEAWALSDGSPEDIAEVAKGKWPLSLKTSVPDFHPNAAGNEFLAERIDNTLASFGWVPGA